ncbi:MAG: hypothetical protein EA401_07030 [Planctomycetota bacterium]|nr:MAG: hypothetical protein EA401_07030 [Planctomycetota bacterium]
MTRPAVLHWQAPPHARPRVVARRTGRQAQGIAPGGPLDQCSAQTCNSLLQQDHQLPVLEWDMTELHLTCLQPCQVVIGGAPRQVLVQGQPALRYHTLSLQPGMSVTLGPACGGVVGYVAVRGGIGECGDRRLACLSAIAPLTRDYRRPPWHTWAAAWAPPAGTLRCLPGPEWGEQWRPFLKGPYQVSANRDRRGIRLTGVTIPPSLSCDIVSGPTVDGAVQMTPHGPIILHRDRGTIGGYARPWILIPTDLNIATQLPTNTPLTFTLL